MAAPPAGSQDVPKFGGLGDLTGPHQISPLASSNNVTEEECSNEEDDDDTGDDNPITSTPIVQPQSMTNQLVNTGDCVYMKIYYIVYCICSLESCPSVYTVSLCSPVLQHWILLLSTCLWSMSCLDFITMIWRLHHSLCHFLATVVCLSPVIVSIINVNCMS